MLAAVPSNGDPSNTQTAGGTQLPRPEITVFAIPRISYESALTITGSTWPHQGLNIRLNGQTVTQTRANESGDFVATVALQHGPNRLQVTASGSDSDRIQSGIFRIKFDSRAIPAGHAGQHVQEKSGSARNSATAPILNPPPSPASANPVTVTGSAPANSTVTFFVNSRETRSVEIDATGIIDTWVPLEDGANAIYAVADDGASQSAASNTVTTDYTNTIPRQYSGTLNSTTVWTKGDGTPYQMTGDFTIANGATLWIQPDISVEIAGDYALQVDGGLTIRGESMMPVVLMPTTPDCDGVAVERSDWQGIRVTAGGIAEIEYAEIHCALRGLYFDGGEGAVNRSLFLNNFVGIETESDSDLNVISPEITMENHIHGSRQAIVVRRNSAPLIAGGNELTDNEFGIRARGSTSFPHHDPAPVVTSNSLYGNSSADYFASVFGNAESTILNATGNWWGTTDPAIIEININDWSDSPTSPTVDFSGYLDGPGGSPVFSGSTIIGPITQDRTLGAGTHQMLANVGVPAGRTLTISEGALIEVQGNHEILVDGNLSVQGTSAQRVVFRPETALCDEFSRERSDWQGISVEPGGTVTIDYAEIHCAIRGVHFFQASGSIKNTGFFANRAGIETESPSATNVTAPQVTLNNEFRRNEYGIKIRKNSAPLITNGNVLTDNEFGVHVTGNSSQSENPNPVVNNSSLFGNLSFDMYTVSFGNPAATTLDATGNWWGTTDPVEIADNIVDQNDSASAPLVAFHEYLNSPGGSPFVGIYDVEFNLVEMRPLVDGPLHASFILNAPSTVTTRVVRDSDDAVVFESSEEFFESGAKSVLWDGTETLGGIAPPDAYRAVLEASNGVDQFIFDPPIPNDPGIFGVVPGSYDPFRNEFYKIMVDMRHPGLIDMQVNPAPSSGASPFLLLDDAPVPAGQSWIYWDGRLPDGSMLETWSGINYPVPTNVRPNLVYIRPLAPEITGTQAAPNIEVKSNPYLIWHSYEQVSTITYRVDLDSMVTVKLLPPGVYDPAHLSAIPVQQNEFTEAFDTNGDPVDHTVEWRGYLPQETNDIATSGEGTFTFTIEASSTISGDSNLYKGVLTIFR